MVDGRGAKPQKELRFLHVARRGDHAQLGLLGLPGPGGDRNSLGECGESLGDFLARTVRVEVAHHNHREVAGYVALGKESQQIFPA